MTENEKLRALLAEARAWDLPEEACKACQHPACEIARRIDAALAEPVATVIDWRSFFLKAVRERDEARVEIDLLRDALTGAENSIAAHNEHEAQLRIEAAEMAREAYERGSKDMREAAAQLFDREAAAWGERLGGIIPKQHADQIRTLPIPQDKL